MNSLSSKTLELYKNRLIPEAIRYWESSLRVKYPYFPIYLGRLCATPQVYYSETTKSLSCDTACAAQTKCGDYINIPESHLDVSWRCALSFLIRLVALLRVLLFDTCRV